MTCLTPTYNSIRINFLSHFRRGQLGNGELCQIDRPEPVESLQGITISSIASGGWHCVGNYIFLIFKFFLLFVWVGCGCGSMLSLMTIMYAYFSYI